MKTLTEAEAKKKEQEIWLEYLAQSTPIDIAKSLVTFNYDGDYLFLNWVKDNPNTCKGLALMCYWYNSPKWQKQYASREESPSFAVENYDFIEDLEQKYLSGFYKVGEVAFDPTNDLSVGSDYEGHDWTAEYADVAEVRKIPELMKQKADGADELIEHPKDFEEGLPVEYAEKLMAFIDEYDDVDW